MQEYIPELYGGKTRTLKDRTISLLIDEAMDREEPSIMKRLKVRISGNLTPELAETLRQVREKGEEISRIPMDRKEIEAWDGTHLVAHWYPAENAKRVILAFHGWRSLWYLDFGVITEFWHDHDCSVLFVEQRACGESGGDYIGFGMLEQYDCVNWAQYAVRELAEGLPVYLCGISLGAATVLMASGRNLPEGLHGIMADCGYTSCAAILEHVAKNNLHLPYYDWADRVSDLVNAKIGCRPDAFSASEALKKNKLPVLFAHGTGDHFVPTAMTRENYRACAAPKELFMVPGAEHGMSYIIAPEKYEAVCMAFWEKYDGQEVSL